MPSTINPALIDETKPAQGDASTANVRANESATKTNFTAAASDFNSQEVVVNGKVTGPAVAVDSDLAQYDGTTGKLLKDGGLSAASFDAAGSAAAVQSNLDALEIVVDGKTTGPAVAVNSNIAQYDGTTGKLLKDGGLSSVSFDAAGSAATVQTNLDTHEGAGTAHAKNYGGTGSADTVARSDHDHDGTYLRDVIEDTTPQLGGTLETKGNDITLTRADDSVQGILWTDPASDGAALGYSSDGSFDPINGAVAVTPGAVTTYGTSAVVVSLKHADSTHQVYAAPDGTLYGAPPPPSGWDEVDTDATDYDLGAPGVGVGTWVSLATLVISTPQEIAIGARVNVIVELEVANKVANRSGSLEIYASVDGSVPGPSDVDDSAVIAPDYLGRVTLSFIDFADLTVPAATTVSIYARANGGSGVGFGLDLLGLTVAPHRLVVSVPSTGGGGTGDVIQGSQTGGTLHTGYLGVWQNFSTKTLQARQITDFTYTPGLSQTLASIPYQQGEDAPLERAAPNDIVRSVSDALLADTANTIDPDVGFAWTPNDITGSVVTPAALTTGQCIIASNSAPTINAPTDDAAYMIAINIDVSTPSLSGFDEVVNTQPTSGWAYLYAQKIGLTDLGVWVNGT